LLYLGVLDRKWTEDTIKIMSTALKNVVDWQLKEKADAFAKTIINNSN